MQFEEDTFQHCNNVVSEVILNNVQNVKLKERLNGLLPEEVNRKNRDHKECKEQVNEASEK